MDFVVGIGRYHASVRFGHRRVVIHIGDILPAGVLADHGVQLDDPGRGFKLLAPAEFTRGQQRAQHGGDAVGTCQLDHRHEVAQDMRQRYVTGILRYVVRPAADDNHLRVQVQHVGPEAYEHLRGGLPADAAAHITVCRKKIGMRLDPQFGDRVAHEDDLRIAHLVVGLFETAEVRPVLGLRSSAEETRKGKGGKK